MKVVIMGLGYIGLPLAAVLANKKIKVHGVDIKKEVVDTINSGNIHITEPELLPLVKSGIKTKYLTANTTPDKSDIFIITVPTPITYNSKPDISYVKSAIEIIAPYLEKNNLIIIKSTCPVNTTTSMVKLLNMLRPDLKNKIYIAYCPERVIPGKTIYEITHNNRIIGGIDDRSADVAALFYGLFSCGELFKTNAKTAEMCKLVENSFRDINIAFANELSILCDKFDINVWELITLANKHPRVNILQPSCGVGGHCIAIDPWFLISAQPNESKVIRAAREGNLYKAEWVINKVKMEIAKFKMEYHTEPIVACMGLTFKPDIDDLRESPALYIAKELAKTNKILFVEPNISTLSNIKLTSFTKAITTANILVFLVAHSQFKNLNISKDKQVLDYCGIYSTL